MPKLPVVVAALEEEELILVRRLAAVRKALENLRSLHQRNALVPAPQLRITDAVREIVRLAGGSPVSPTEVRDQLRDLGFGGEHYKNLTAIVHNILRRLPEVKRTKDEETGRYVYLWSAPPSNDDEAP